MAAENEYLEIVNYYDNLLTSGYYNFQSLSQDLKGILGDRKKIIDIGVGTGLLTEKMLEIDDYQVVGVDFSPKMLDLAKERLAGTNVQLVCEDIAKFDTDEKFDAIVSTGGAIYFVEEEGEYRLYSHITDKVTNEQLVVKLQRFLSNGGLVALAIQGQHKNYRTEIKDGVVYEQKIEKDGPYLNKWYTFTDAQGKVLTEQFCRFYFFDAQQTHAVFDAAGFSQDNRGAQGGFWISYK